MSLFNAAQLTFNGKEAQEFADVVVENIFAKPALEEFHSVDEDIVAKEQIAILGRINKISKKDPGCGQGKENKTIPMSEKFWNPSLIKVWLTFCHSELEKAFPVWKKKKGDAISDMTDSEIMDLYLVETVEDAMYEDALRIAWLSDTAIAKVANGGTLADHAEANVNDYNQIDGFIKQLITIGTNTPARRVVIAENAGATFEDQQTLPDDAARKIFKELYNKADFRLRGQADKVIVATQSLVDNYADYLDSRNLDASFVRIEEGFTMLKYRNMTIIGFNLLDRYIAEDFVDATKYTVGPHFAVLTTPNVLRIGVDAKSSLSEFSVWYSMDDETNNIRGKYKLDAKVILDYSVQVAY